jgi:hypothetical protein
MLPTPDKLREHSRWCRQAVANATDVATRCQLASHALTLALIAEAIEREGAAGEKERYRGLLAGPLGENVRRLVAEMLGRPRSVPDASGQIIDWRMRAEELRMVADQFIVPAAQEEALRRAVAHYERLADDAEALFA